jgi:small subunit ribosomal protein S4
MARYTGPKDRLSRREGFDLFGKATKITRLNVPPGMHGPKGELRQKSQYGRQLREKQKVKRMYGIMEKQFKKYVREAFLSKGNTADALFSLLEKRLDNVIYRLGFSSTRPQARQLVSHRHVLVNGKKINIPSYQLKVGDTITLSSKSLNVPKIANLIEDKNYKVPDWLERKRAAGQVKRDDIHEAITDQDIIEFYSR